MQTEYKLKPITETSWILQHNGTKLAMLISTPSGLNVIGNLKYKHFIDLDDMASKLNCKISFEEVDQPDEPEVGEVMGYPIKHGVAFNESTEKYPNYSKIEGSSNRFAAGYYGVLFAHGWVPSYCPKVSTLEDKEWIGPFKTKFEMLMAISSKKKELKI